MVTILSDVEVSQHVLLLTISLILYQVIEFGCTTKVLELLKAKTAFEIAQDILTIRLINFTIALLPAILLIKLFSSYSNLYISVADIMLIFFYILSLLLNLDVLSIYHRESKRILNAGIRGGLALLFGLIVTSFYKSHIASFTALTFASFVYSNHLLQNITIKQKLYKLLQPHKYVTLLKSNLRVAEVSVINAAHIQLPMLIVTTFSSPSVVSSFFIFQRFNQVLRMPTSYFVQGMATKMSTEKNKINRILLRVAVIFISVNIVALAVSFQMENWLLKFFNQDALQEFTLYLIFSLTIPMMMYQDYYIQSLVISKNLRTYVKLTLITIVVAICTLFFLKDYLTLGNVVLITMFVSVTYTSLLKFSQQYIRDI